MRFPAEQHLRRPGEIRVVREQGKRVECRAFTVWWKRREEEPSAAQPACGARVCVIASTAAVGNAVRRNRAKRRLREVFRLQQTAVPANCDLLMIARRAVLDSSWGDLQARFTEACDRMAAKDPAR